MHFKQADTTHTTHNVLNHVSPDFKDSDQSKYVILWAPKVKDREVGKETFVVQIFYKRKKTLSLLVTDRDETE